MQKRGRGLEQGMRVRCPADLAPTLNLQGATLPHQLKKLRLRGLPE